MNDSVTVGADGNQVTASVHLIFPSHGRQKHHMVNINKSAACRAHGAMVLDAPPSCLSVQLIGVDADLVRGTLMQP